MKKILMVNGSPRNRISASASLLARVEKKVNRDLFDIDSVSITAALRDPDKLNGILEQAVYADIIVIAFPLYIDSLPSITLRFLKRFQEYKEKKDYKNNQILFTIINCGFPEAEHNRIALEIMYNFTGETGLKWGLGLGIGMGSMAGGEKIPEKSRILKPVENELNLMANRINNCERERTRAETRFVLPSFPKFLYLFAATAQWKILGKKNGVKRLLKQRPYAESL